MCCHDTIVTSVKPIGITLELFKIYQKQMNMRFFTLSILLFYFTQSLHSQSSIVLNEDNKLFYIGQFCETKANEPQNVTIDKIIHDTTFSPNKSEHILLGGKRAKNIWIKFSVENSKIDYPYLELSFPLIDKATLYTLEDNKVVSRQESGQNQPFDSRLLHTNSLIFNLKKAEARPVTYYLNLQVKWICNVKPQIGTYKSILKAHHYHDLLQGFFFGLLLVLILYNFFIYLKLKDSVYLYYSLYLLCGSGFILRHEGLTVEFLFNSNPSLNDYSLILPPLAGFFGMLFSIKFLNTKKELPVIDKILKASLIFFAISLALVFIGYFELSLVASHTITPFSSTIIIFAAIIIWRRGDTTAKYYLLGWAFLTIGLTIFLCENSGFIPPSIFTEYALHAGVSMEAIVLSYAIAHKFGMIKEEQNRIQQDMIKMFKHNQDLINHQNRLLEQKVEERTQALQEALEEVNDKEEKLQEYAYRLENSNRELMEFAHIASHDLKAPIRGILSFAQLFERRNKDKFDKTDLEYFNYIKSNAIQSSRLIEDLLNYSKVDKNLGEPTDVDINECISIAEMNLQTIIREKNAIISYENLPILRGHTSLIIQLFQNLINNGIKYNKSLKPTIKISVKPNERNECVFSISDNGIGIAAENQDKIFAMFRRLHSQSEYEGTGIGLSFCTRIVETYGGKIWVESTPDIGSTFYFTLPKAKKNIIELAAA